jgi:uncharacterized protein YeaO (DUF488 family)
MSIRHAIWKVGTEPQALNESTLSSEILLEVMIKKAPSILSDEWMLIGQQENTGYGGRIDLLAIAPDGSLILIELKRNKTPRDVVAQALDYASWVEKLRPEDIVTIYSRFAPNRDLSVDFQKRFNAELDEESLNQAHQIVVVAASLDESTERIVQYLNKRDIAINVLFFQVFNHGSEQLLSRAWFMDPTQVQVITGATDEQREPWNGEFYVSFLHDATRSWNEAVRYGFISAGGGEWYSKTLQLLKPNDRIWVNIPKTGYAGVGQVCGFSTPAAEFKVMTSQGEQLFMALATEGNYHRDYINNTQKSEYFVAVRWIKTVPVQEVISEIGLFGNQNTVCKPTAPKWRHTIERLKDRFKIT